MTLLDRINLFAKEHGVPACLTWLPEYPGARHSLQQSLGHAFLILEGGTARLPGLLFVYHLEEERSFLATEIPTLHPDPDVPRRFFTLSVDAPPTEISRDQAMATLTTRKSVA